MSGRYLTALCWILVLSRAFPTVYANFLSRMVNFGGEKDSSDNSSAPAGITAARSPEAQAGSAVAFEDGIVMAYLANNNKIPLVGVGVGNSPSKQVQHIVEEAIHDKRKTRLIDTSHSGTNEKLVAQGILEGINKMELQQDEKVQIHVMTKVWYTHLGYERTKFAVQETLENFKGVSEHKHIDLKMHILIHWPRCFDNIHWMNCEEEESKLPAYIREAGPTPSTDAWKDSWKLLEDMYLSDQYPIASIGVSNFHLHDIEQMNAFARIHPHTLQVNIWSLLYDAPLIEYCHKRRIHVQVYNTLEATIGRAGLAPRAMHHIQKIAYDVSDKSGSIVTPAQIILAWLIQHGVSVIPRTSRLNHLQENSAASLLAVPGFDDTQVETLAHAVEAYLSQKDLDKDLYVSVSFHAVNKDLMIYWKGKNEDQDGYIALVRQGETFNETTFPNHIFRTYDAKNKDHYVDHRITANFGDHRSIQVEL